MAEGNEKFEKGWGGIYVDPNPKKTEAHLEIDMKTGTLKGVKYVKTAGETKQSRFDRIKAERGRRMGFKPQPPPNPNARRMGRSKK